MGKNIGMLILSTILLICVFLINATNKLVLCSFFFTFSILIANSITEFYSKKKAISILILCVLVNAALAWQKFSLMLIINFVSLFVSFYFSTSLLKRFNSKFNFSIRNFINSIICVIIDVGILSIAYLLVSEFTLDQVIRVGIKSLILKVSCASIISFCLFMILSLLQKLYDNYWGMRKHIR